MKVLLKFVNDEQGATAIEYGLMAGLVSVAIIGGLQLLGSQLETIFNAIATAIASAL